MSVNADANPASEDEDGEFEVRADHVTESVLREHTAKGDWFEQIHGSLVSPTLTLLIGPRGCGKTHMMRYTWLRCIEDAELPLAIYVSFNRYLRLEPLLKTRSDAIRMFQIWILCRIIQALSETTTRVPGLCDFDAPSLFNLDGDALDLLIGKLERAVPLDASDDPLVAAISTESVVKAIGLACKASGRKRVVLMLDDAALTLTPEYLYEFFDTVRVLKRTSIAPKCSVYPGTTEYGPRFHAHHEGVQVQAWLPAEGDTYRATMNEIGQLRYPEGSAQLSKDVKDLLIYAAFGIPRAYLSLLRQAHSDHAGSQQATINSVVQQHRDGILAEFRSLGKKMPRFATVVRVGEEFFGQIVNSIRNANDGLTENDTKQLLIGIDATLTPIQSRMIDLLIEAGLLYEHSEVSHGGPERRYRRFTPHIAALIAARAFLGGRRGTSASIIVEYLDRRPAKHPVRRTINTLLSAEQLENLKLDLPACQECNTPRMAESQRFCHACGARLADPSTFNQLMLLPIDEAPNLTVWQRQRVFEHGIKNIGDLLSLSDPGTELRKIHRVGNRRAQDILQRVEAYVDEFLS